MRYAGSHNFVGRPIDGYEAPRCLLTKPPPRRSPAVARDLRRAASCSRYSTAIGRPERWRISSAGRATSTTGPAKREFYPDVDKSTLFRDGYISSRSGHSRGSTDRSHTGAADGHELDMGTPFDFFSPRSWPAAANVSAEAKANRALLAAAMRRHGFRPYDKEWWHFTLSHEPFPDTYFDFPVR